MRWTVVWLISACAAHEPARPRDNVSESAPEPFFGIAGLTRTTESGTGDNGWTRTSFENLLVHRGDRVVCRLGLGGHGGGDGRSWLDDAHLELSSQQPVRFVIRHQHTGNDVLGAHETCDGYELPVTGDCRQVFERQCSHEVCTPNVAIAPTCGSGTLKGHITQAREPVVGADVVVGQHDAFTDEHGAFAIESGPGSHVLEINGVHRVNVPVGPGEDVDVTIDIACSSVTDTGCCSF